MSSESQGGGLLESRSADCDTRPRTEPSTSRRSVLSEVNLGLGRGHLDRWGVSAASGSPSCSRAEAVGVQRKHRLDPVDDATAQLDFVHPPSSADVSGVPRRARGRRASGERLLEGCDVPARHHPTGLAADPRLRQLADVAGDHGAAHGHRQRHDAALGSGEVGSDDDPRRPESSLTSRSRVPVDDVTRPSWLAAQPLFRSGSALGVGTPAIVSVPGPGRPADRRRR